MISLLWFVSRDDFSMINADYATFFSNLPLTKINQMEVHLLHLFNFSVEITLEEYEKMNKTIQELNNAAIIMHLRMVIPLPSPHLKDSRGGVSISGRRSFQPRAPLHDYEEEDPELFSNSSSVTPTAIALTASSTDRDLMGDDTEMGLYSTELKTPSNSPQNTFLHHSSSMKSQSLSLQRICPHGGDEMVQGQGLCVISESMVDDQGECLGEERERPGTARQLKRRTSIQIAVDNALSVLVKYFPPRSASLAKVHVTNETDLS
jgi:hypothetical protein